MTKDNNDVRRIVEDNENRSGFALELYLHSILSQDYEVLSNDYFLDFDTNVSRSIDLLVKGLGESAIKVDFGIDMVIECKKSENNAWVFFMTQDTVSSLSTGQFIDHRQIFKNDFTLPCVLSDYESPSTEDAYANYQIMHYGREYFPSKFAASYHVSRKGKEQIKDDTKNEVFEAINQVLKYITYDYKNRKESFVQRLPRIMQTPMLHLHYPIIAFDGSLYEGHFVNERIQLRDTQHVVLKYQFNPPYMTRPKTFLVDIVKKEYFPSFMKIITKECDKFCKIADRHSDAMQEWLDKLMRGGG